MEPPVHLSEYPNYKADWKKRVGVLRDTFVCQTPITGRLAAIHKVTLAKDGILWIREGYVWDFGSGPAIDTPEMIFASLAHDAFYDLMKAGQLPRGSTRKQVDDFFRLQLLQAGASPLRAWYCWAAVRAFGGLHNRNSSKRESLDQPHD